MNSGDPPRAFLMLFDCVQQNREVTVEGIKSFSEERFKKSRVGRISPPWVQEGYKVEASKK